MAENNLPEKTPNQNRRNDTDTVLARLKQNRPDLFTKAEVVGVWVWLSFESKPDTETREYLKAEGFRWNRRRAAWQHACGIWRPRAAHNPRFTFGTVPANLYDRIPPQRVEAEEREVA